MEQVIGKVTTFVCYGCGKDCLYKKALSKHIKRSPKCRKCHKCHKWHNHTKPPIMSKWSLSQGWSLSKSLKSSRRYQFVRDILNKVFEEAVAPEYEELCNIKIKCEKKEELFVEPALSEITQKNLEEELENFQRSVYSAVMNAMNIYYSGKYQEEPMKSGQGTFLQTAGEMINRLSKEIKDSYMVLHGGLQDIHLTPDNQLFIRNQVQRYLGQDLQTNPTPPSSQQAVTVNPKPGE